MKYLILSFFVIGTVLAQQQTFSPYSEYGIGELQEFGQPSNTGMGGLGVGIANRFALNPINPASYSQMRYTTLDFSAHLRNQKLRSSRGSAEFNTGGLNNLGFIFTKPGIPFGVGAGLAPYSRVGFEVRSLVDLPTDTTTTSFLTEAYGNGGVNKFYLGAGWAMGTRWSVGAQFIYLFGSQTSNYTTGFASFDSNGGLRGFNTATQVKIQRNTRLRNARLNLGVQFTDTLFVVDKLPDSVVAKMDPAKRERVQKEQGAATKYRLGLIADLPIWGGVKFENFLEGNRGGGLYVPFDTLAQGNVLPASFPYTLGLGASLYRDLRYTLGVDFVYENWSRYSLDGKSVGLQDRFRVALGSEWIPSRIPGDIRTNIFKRMTYRAGLFYEKSYLKIGDNQINGMGASLGLGIPIVKTSANRLDIAGTWTTYGTESNGLVQENHLRLVVGISFTELWLRPYKYK